jgi:hypothetical protein
LLTADWWSCWPVWFYGKDVRGSLDWVESVVQYHFFLFLKKGTLLGCFLNTTQPWQWPKKACYIQSFFFSLDRKVITPLKRKCYHFSNNIITLHRLQYELYISPCIIGMEQDSSWNIQECMLINVIMLILKTYNWNAWPLKPSFMYPYLCVVQ